MIEWILLIHIHAFSKCLKPCSVTSLGMQTITIRGLNSAKQCEELAAKKKNISMKWKGMNYQYLNTSECQIDGWKL